MAMTQEQFAAYIASLRDWKQDLNTLADCLEQLWADAGGGEGITGGDGITVAAGVVSVDPTLFGNGLDYASGVAAVKISTDANNGASLSATDQGVFAIKPA